MDVAILASSEHAIKPIEKPPQQPLAGLLRFENQRSQRRTERKRVESRKDHGNSDGHGELLVEAPRYAWNECRRDKYRGKNQRDPDDGTRDFLHGPEGRLLGRHAIFDMTFHCLNHHDGVIHHQTDSKHQTKQRKRIDGETKSGEEDERADQRYRDSQQRNQRGAPALQKDVDHDNHQPNRDQQGYDNLPNSFRNRTCRVQRNRVVDTLREAFLGFRHQFIDTLCSLNCVGTGQLIDGDYGAGLPI